MVTAQQVTFTEEQQQLAVQFVPLAKKLACEFHLKNPCVSETEFFSAAIASLVAGSRKFNALLGVAPITFFYTVIRNALLTFCDSSSVLRLQKEEPLIFEGAKGMLIERGTCDENGYEVVEYQDFVMRFLMSLAPRYPRYQFIFMAKYMGFSNAEIAAQVRERFHMRETFTAESVRVILIKIHKLYNRFVENER